MVNLSPARRAARLDSAFAALADPTRRAILVRLAGGPATVGEIGRPFPISAPAITKHVRTLEAAGLVRRRIEGRVHHLTLVPEALDDTGEWIDAMRRFWLGRLDALERHLEATAPKPATRTRRPSAAKGAADKAAEESNPRGAGRGRPAGRRKSKRA